MSTPNGLRTFTLPICSLSGSSLLSGLRSIHEVRDQLLATDYGSKNETSHEVYDNMRKLVGWAPPPNSLDSTFACGEHFDFDLNSLFVDRQELFSDFVDNIMNITR